MKGKNIKHIIAGFMTAVMTVSLLSVIPAVKTNAAEATYFKKYDKAGYETLSEDFELKVNGQNVDVVTYFQGRYSYAHIAYEGTTTFEIKAKHGNITEYNISPHSYGIAATLNGDTITFDLEQKGSRYLVMDITAGGQKEQLIVAADPQLDIEEPGADGKPVINMKERGLVEGDNGDGSDNSALIQNAINELSKQGGGTVYFPEGWYKFVSLDAKSNVTLYLDDGAVLRGSGDRTEYSWSDSGQNGRQATRRDILINNVENFSIIGTGMIDANSCILALPQNADGGTTEVPDIPQGDYYPTGWDDFRKGIVDGNNSNGIRFEGVTFKDATGWTFNINSSNNIHITNVKMLNDYEVVHSDGYDICACQDVLVSECLGVCGDDVFCPKGNNSNREMKNYLFENGVAYARGGSGCKVGVQAKSTTYNIEFNNIDVIQGYRGFSISRDEGNGNWSDIRFIDIRTEKIWIESTPTDSGQYRSAPFIIWALQKNNEVGNVSDVLVKNCSIEDCSGIKGILKGETTSDGRKGVISNVTFENFVMEGRTITNDNWNRKITMTGNVEKDTIAFKHDEILTPAFSVYEAETGEKNGANSAKAEECSARWLAGNIGQGNTVTLTVYAEAADVYDVDVYACSQGNRTFYISVNGEAVTTLDCNSGSFTKPAMQTIQLNLKAGENKITFGNPDNYAPNLDRIVVHEKEAEQLLSIEAEAAQLSGQAEISKAANCSNDYKVGYVGGGENNGTVTFHVVADEAAKRTLKIYHAALDARPLGVRVNDGQMNQLDCMSTGGWNTAAETPVIMEIDLNAGANTIVITGVEGTDAPNLDRIEVELTYAEAAKTVDKLIENLPEEPATENDNVKVFAVELAYNKLNDKTGVTNVGKLDAAITAAGGEGIAGYVPVRTEGTPYVIEAEAGNLSGGTALVANTQASNAYHVGNVGGNNNGAVTFTVNAKSEGKCNLDIYYATLNARQTNVIVNDVPVAALQCQGTGGWTTPGETPVSVEIELKEGNNIIILTGVEAGYAPNIDKIVLNLTEEEIKDTVLELINNLPLEVTNTNRIVVETIKEMAANAGITDNAELNAAVSKAEALDKIEGVKDFEINAEAGRLTGNAELVGVEEAENGCHIGNVGGPDNGAVTFTVNADVAGKRILKVYYTTAAKRDLCVYVNEDPAITLECDGNSWYIPNEEPVTTQITLKQGLNTITFSGNGTDYAPNIDRIVLELTDNEAKNFVSELINNNLPDDVSGTNKAIVSAINSAYENLTDKEGVQTDALTQALEKARAAEIIESAKDFEIETEAAKLGGSAVLVTDDAANGSSNDCYVGEVGGAGNGTVTFEVNAEVAGERTMKVYYCTVGERQLSIHVNGNALEAQTCGETGGWSIPCAEPLEVKVNLNAGNNTISFGGVDGAPAPNIDRIVIKLTDTEAKSVVSNLIQNIPTEVTDENKGSYAEVVNAINKAYENLTDQSNMEGADVLKTAIEKAEELESADDNTGDNNNGDGTGDDNPGNGNNGDGTGDDSTGDNNNENGDNNTVSGNTGGSNNTGTGDGNTGNNNNGSGTGTEGDNKGEGQQTAPKVKVSKIKLTGISRKIAAGKKITLTAKVEPADAANKAVKWTSSNKKYATVSRKGVVKTKKSGKNKTVTITATAKDGSGVKAKYKIKIMPNAVTKVSIEAKTKTVKAGNKLTLKAIVTPDLSSKKMNKTIKWTSSNKKYATVSQKGVVKAKKAGKGKTVKITAAATDGSNKKKTVKIKIR